MSDLGLIRDLDNIDEKYISEAAPKVIPQRNIKAILSAIAAVLLIAVGAGIWITQNNKTVPAGNNTAIINEDDNSVLYEDDVVKVSRINGHAGGTVSSEYCLAYFTEWELLNNCDVLLRARITDVVNISIENKKMEQMMGSRWVTEACILTLEPVRVIRGELSATGPIKVYVDKYINSSLADLTLSLNNSKKGAEGLFMISKSENNYVGYPTELAEYAAGDSQRYAIIYDGKSLLFDHSSFPGFSASWNLDSAESYASMVAGGLTAAPDDFEFSISWEYWGYDQSEKHFFSYDSKTGRYSLVGDAGFEDEYGPENLTADIMLEQDLINKIYNSCKRLDEMPETIPSDTPAGDKYSEKIEIAYVANGKGKRVVYSGPYISNNTSLVYDLLKLTETEIQHYLESSPSVIAWWNSLAEFIR